MTPRSCAAERPFAMAKPCAECPWRKDVEPGRFPPSRYVKLADTVRQDMQSPVFACHKSPEGEERACAGFCLSEGSRNLRVRLAIFGKRLDYDAMEKAAEGLDLFDTYRDMAIANGARVRDDGSYYVPDRAVPRRKMRQRGG